MSNGFLVWFVYTLLVGLLTLHFVLASGHRGDIESKLDTLIEMVGDSEGGTG